MKKLFVNDYFIPNIYHKVNTKLWTVTRSLSPQNSSHSQHINALTEFFTYTAYIKQFTQRLDMGKHPLVSVRKVKQTKSKTNKPFLED